MSEGGDGRHRRRRSGRSSASAVLRHGPLVVVLVALVAANAWMLRGRGATVGAPGASPAGAPRTGTAPGPDAPGEAAPPPQAIDPLLEAEAAARRDPGDRPTIRRLAAVRHERCVAVLLDGDPDDAHALFSRPGAGGAARVLCARAPASEAQRGANEAVCRELLAATPGDVPLTLLLATLLLQKGTPEAATEAAALFAGRMERSPDDVLAEFGLATARFHGGDSREALAGFRRVYARSRSNPCVATALCECMAAAGEVRAAVELLDAECAAHPTSWAFPHLKGEFLLQQGESGLAVMAYLEAMRRDPRNATPLLAAASALASASRVEDARKLLAERETETRDPARVAVALADVLVRLGRVGEAQDAIVRALAASPGHPRALAAKGRLAESRGATAEAKSLYAEALERGTDEGDCHARLARILAAEGDHSGAREAWRGALHCAPREPEYLVGLARATALDDAHVHEALGYAQIAAEIAPSRGDVLDTYGWLLFRAGRHREACDVLARAAVLLQHDAAVQFHAGMALSRAGRTPEARMHLERSLRIDPAFDGAAMAREELERLR